MANKVSFRKIGKNVYVTLYNWETCRISTLECFDFVNYQGKKEIAWKS